MLTDILFPRTDAGVAVQVVLVVGLAGAGLFWSRRYREVQHVILGLLLLVLGMMALRAVH